MLLFKTLLFICLHYQVFELLKEKLIPVAGEKQDVLGICAVENKLLN